ncbi:unnamed protein product [Adineta steineri]|uniref:G-protein coupled receptors family 1 profile domain-containing protein n=1 Tax=Adineta steineri TaxID=433720 RepID=A0A819RT33_9BILA|nr:unnamed protein product [Adineta steineri]
MTTTTTKTNTTTTNATATNATATNTTTTNTTTTNATTTNATATNATATNTTATNVTTTTTTSSTTTTTTTTTTTSSTTTTTTTTTSSTTTTTTSSTTTTTTTSSTTTSTTTTTNPSCINLLVNPGGEDGVLSPWVVGGSSNPQLDSGTFDIGFGPHTGSYQFVGGTGSSGTLTQTIVIMTASPSITASQIDTVNDKRNCMTTKPASAEVKLRWNATLKCADMYNQFSLNISMNQTFNLNLTETNTTSSLIILLRFEIFAACLTYGLGFIGNLFALIVFSSLLEFRRISTGILFLLMTISNFFHLWTLAIDFLGICGYSIYSNIYLQCHLSPFVENVSRAMSTYFSVGIAVDRFIRSEMPLRSKMICTRKNIFIVTIIIFIIFCLFWSFYLYPFSSQILITGECIYNQSISFEFFLVNIHIPLRAIFFCLIPIIIMTASNIRMMSNIRQARMRVSDIPQNNDGYKSSTIISSTAISGPVGRRTLAIDRMLLLMMAASVLTFIITQIPFHIYMVVQVNIHTFNSYTDSLIYSMLLIWSSIYFGIAFYLYCLASPLFRRKFIRIGRKLINCQLIHRVTT